MGIFSRKQSDDVGQVSEPEGDGPVTLSDRNAPGGEGSPDTNQAKTEPMSPTPDHPEPLAVPVDENPDRFSGRPAEPRIEVLRRVIAYEQLDARWCMACEPRRSFDRGMRGRRRIDDDEHTLNFHEVPCGLLDVRPLYFAHRRSAAR